MQKEITEYNLLGNFLLHPKCHANQLSNDIQYIAKQFPYEYNIIKDRYIDMIIAQLQFFNCTFMHLDTLDAHKWMIRDMLKHNKPEAKKVINIIFSFHEEQRLNLSLTRQLLGYAVDGYCCVSVTNHSRRVEICINNEFDTYMKFPTTLPDFFLNWDIKLNRLKFECRLINI